MTVNVITSRRTRNRRQAYDLFYVATIRGFRSYTSCYGNGDNARMWWNRKSPASIVFGFMGHILFYSPAAELQNYCSYSNTMNTFYGEIESLRLTLLSCTRNYYHVRIYYYDHDKLYSIHSMCG